MPREISIDGMFMPSLLPVFVAIALLYWLIDTLLGRFGFYSHVWHPALFRLSLFVCLFGLAAGIAYQ